MLIDYQHDGNNGSYSIGRNESQKEAFHFLACLISLIDLNLFSLKAFVLQHKLKETSLPLLLLLLLWIWATLFFFNEIYFLMNSLILTMLHSKSSLDKVAFYRALKLLVQTQSISCLVQFLDSARALFSNTWDEKNSNPSNWMLFSSASKTEP